MDDQRLIELAGRLTTPIPEIRHSILQFFELEYKSRPDGIPDALATVLRLHETPVNLTTARNIAMYMRRLGVLVQKAQSDSVLQPIVIHFLFGFFNINYTPLWEDVCSALAEIAKASTAASIIAEICVAWITNTSNQEFDNEVADEAAEVSRRLISDGQRPTTSDTERLLKIVEVAPDRPAEPRGHGLRVFHHLSTLAERNSRYLIPSIREWANNVDDNAVEGSKAKTVWSRKDQISLLQLFGKFTNPRGYVSSDEVYQALLQLMVTGDIGVQKGALQALFCWKLPSVKPYEADLTNLLDESQFRDGLDSFVNMSQDEHRLRSDHRPDLVKILLRLLYGRTLRKTNTTGGRRSMDYTRHAVLQAMTTFQLGEIHEFIGLSKQAFAKEAVIQSGSFNEELYAKLYLPLRKQAGMLRMYEDMLKVMKLNFKPYIDDIVPPVIFCLVKSTRGLATTTGDEAADRSEIGAMRNIRHSAIKCLTTLFQAGHDEDWNQVLPVLFDEIINPRIDRFAVETAQSVSGLLHLIASWTEFWQTTPFIYQYNESLMGHILDGLVVPSAKPEVKLFILKIVHQLTERATSEDTPEIARKDIVAKIIRPSVDKLLSHALEVLGQAPQKDLLESTIEAIFDIAPFVEGTSQASKLLDSAIFLLGQPSKKVSQRSKTHVLSIVLDFLPFCNIADNADLFERLYIRVSSCFGYWRGKKTRQALAKIVSKLAESDPSIETTGYICIELNSYDESRLDEPDYDRQFKAYSLVLEKASSFGPRQWRPIVDNMLFFIEDENELAVRSRAVTCLKSFIDFAQARLADNDEIGKAFEKLLVKELWLRLKAGIATKSEIIRSEYLLVISHLVSKSSTIPQVSDLHYLLFDGDEEVSFFHNVLHIQLHRRIRAVRRLAEEATKSRIGSQNAQSLLIPLLEHFIIDQTDETLHNLANEAILAIGALAQCLRWAHFKRLFMAHSKRLKVKNDDEDAPSLKPVLRVISGLIDALSKAEALKRPLADDDVSMEDRDKVEASREVLMEDADTAMELIDAVIEDNDADESTKASASSLSETLPDKLTLNGAIESQFLPNLAGYLHQKDETTVSQRVPVATSVVKLINMLPFEKLSLALPPVLTDIAQILRSKDQIARDMARTSLSEIAAFLSSECLGFILKELRGSLRRGSQLHVLAYTVNSILVAALPKYQTGDIDYCLSEIVNIVVEDVFGAIGQEKDSEGYVTSSKEIRTKKSYDIMEMLAQISSVHRLGTLLQPFRSLLLEKVTLQTVNKIDELLRRITVGIAKNSEADKPEVLVLCFEIIRSANQAERGEYKPVDRGKARDRYIVKLAAKRQQGATTSYIFKLSRYGIDLLRTLLTKNSHLLSPEYVEGFVPIIGDALLQSHEEVQIAAVRVLTLMIKCPVEQLQNDAGVYAREAVSFIKSSPSTGSELVQASLKLLSAIIKEHGPKSVKETALAYVIQRVKPDLEEPEKQGITFSFLRSVMNNRILVPELYETMDSVRNIMVTNHSRQVRDMSRGAYMQFMMDYPQSQKRFNHQVVFLVKNLEYPHSDGRQSVMEVLNSLLVKLKGELLTSLIHAVSVPLALLLVNDEVPQCREMAGLLLREVFQRSPEEVLLISQMRSWLSQDENPMLRQLSLQCHVVLQETETNLAQKEFSFLQKTLPEILKTETDEEDDWKAVYFSLQIVQKASQKRPSQVFDSTSEPLWRAVCHSIKFQHSWVKLASSRLMGALFGELARSNASIGFHTVPLSAKGFELDSQTMLELCRHFLGSLRNIESSQELLNQMVKNLVFLGRCFAANGFEWEYQDHEDYESDNEEKVTAFGHLTQSISRIVRDDRAPVNSRLLSKIATLRLLAALCSLVPKELVVKHIETILYSVYTLNDSSIPLARAENEHKAEERQEELRSLAQEMVKLVQDKVGSDLFVETYSKIREQTRKRREERRIKRRIEAVSKPERTELLKKRRHKRAKIRRKAKGSSFREMRRGFR
jgi:U3 small nucleolar RNA-associated protein 20